MSTLEYLCLTTASGQSIPVSLSVWLSILTCTYSLPSCQQAGSASHITVMIILPGYMYFMQAMCQQPVRAQPGP